MGSRPRPKRYPARQKSSDRLGRQAAYLRDRLGRHSYAARFSDRVRSLVVRLDEDRARVAQPLPNLGVRHHAVDGKVIFARCKHP